MTNKTMPTLDVTIQSRLDKLKSQCHEVCGDVENGHVRRSSTAATIPTQPLHEFFSSVQLWKERSLYHTLEALDKAGVVSMDSHTEAMEDHEKAAKDLFELTRGFLTRIRHDLNLHLDTFEDDLSRLVDAIIASRLEEQRLVHENAVKSLKEENQRVVQTCQELKDANGDLERRLESLENDSGSGDATLCTKLRGRVQHLVIRQRELSTELEGAALDRVKHRRELDKMKTQLTECQKSLALTRAMHEKETRQLAAMVQLNHAQVRQVLKASRDSVEPRRQQSLERFDPLSGCTIVHLSPVATPQKPPGTPVTSTSPRRASSPILATSPSEKSEKKLGAPVNPRQRLVRPKSAGSSGSRRSSVSPSKSPRALHSRAFCD